MSVHEQNPGWPAEDPDVPVFGDIDAGVMAALCEQVQAAEAKEQRERDELFDRLATQLNLFKECRSTTTSSDDVQMWQSFYTVPAERGKHAVLIVGKPYQDNQEYCHIVSCKDIPTEGADAGDLFEYEEYAIDLEGKLMRSVAGRAYQPKGAGGWATDMLGGCALVYRMGDRAVLLRGDKNTLLMPSKDLQYKRAENQLVAESNTIESLQRVNVLLDGLLWGPGYEENITGDIY